LSTPLHQQRLLLGFIVIPVLAAKDIIVIKAGKDIIVILVIKALAGKSYFYFIKPLIGKDIIVIKALVGKDKNIKALDDEDIIVIKALASR
jgi:hypothetical protein